MQIQIWVKQKMLGRSVTFGPKSVDKRLKQENFFELTTPTTRAMYFHATSFILVDKVGDTLNYFFHLSRCDTSQFKNRLTD